MDPNKNVQRANHRYQDESDEKYDRAQAEGMIMASSEDPNVGPDMNSQDDFSRNDKEGNKVPQAQYGKQGDFQNQNYPPSNIFHHQKVSFDQNNENNFEQNHIDLIQQQYYLNEINDPAKVAEQVRNNPAIN